MTRIALALVLLVGCAPAVRYSECDPATACPAGTVCQQVSGQHASCTTLCTTPQDVCEGGAARCFLGPYADTSGQPIYLCRQPCDVRGECPAGLACMQGEVVDGVGLWCM